MKHNNKYNLQEIIDTINDYYWCNDVEPNEIYKYMAYDDIQYIIDTFAYICDVPNTNKWKRYIIDVVKPEWIKRYKQSIINAKLNEIDSDFN